LGAAGLGPIRRFAGHQRAFVKVQDGCDAFCRYCIVPHLRRRIRSRPAEEIITEIEGLIAAGHREVVLCGVSLGAYGRATTRPVEGPGPAPLVPLLDRVAALPGLWRVRLSSLHPADMTADLLAVIRDRPAVAPHLHLPLQSGSDAVLAAMGRPYSATDFLAAVDAFRGVAEDAAVTTDVIVGYPGESEADFAATTDLARRAAFGRMHVFGFSPRRGTPAWHSRCDAPPAEVVRDRSARLRELGEDLAADYRRRFLGRRVECLIEKPNSKTPPGCARALTDRYVEVYFPAERPRDLAGRVVAVEVETLAPGGVMSRLTDAVDGQ
jgi:threonylcarbamoyladenosine tRNA methylthiotransferase MtaB